MNVSKLGVNTPSSTNSIGFAKKSNEPEYENPVSRGTERNLAVLKSVAGATVLGAIVSGFASFIVNTEKHAGESFIKKNKIALLIGAAAAGVSLIVTLPANLYNTKVNAFVKQKEMDIFTRDRELKSDLTEEVGKEVKNEDVSLDKKLDDNLKLQMANRGAAIGIANVTSQPQG